MGGQAEPGRVIGGRYRLLARLGSGGMGRVWRASDEALRVEVAVKEVWLPAAPGPDADERLLRAEREARNAARLRDHPNVVAVHDVVVEDGVPWTVMQLVAGHTLEEHVAEFGPLSVAHTALVADALLDALEAAHAAGIVHRDVKPANVMLADDGKVLLTDFGIAIADADTALTAAGSFLGSVEYIAPERARGTEGLAASDLFSLGVTLFQAVEGFSPFHRETATGTLTAVILDEAPAPARAGWLSPLIAGLLEKEPGARTGIPEARRLLAARKTTTAAAATAPGADTAPGLDTPHRQGTASGRGTAGTPLAAAAHRGPGGMPAASAAQRGAAVTAPRAPGTASGPTPPHASGPLPPRRPTGTGRRPSQGTDQRRRVPAQQSAERRRQPPTADPRRPTGPGRRPVPPAPARRRGVRPRAVILLILVAATIAAVLVTVLKPASFAVTGVKVGDFVKVDGTGHITGTVSESKARTSPDGRRVTARENRADPEVCKRLHAPGRPDVEQRDSVSFCLIRPLEEAAVPAQ